MMTSEVSLHLETGEVLEDTLQLGDCYAGLMVVRKVWLSNCCSGSDQRIFNVKLSSDFPAEVDFEISQTGSHIEYDTAAKRRKEGIVSTTSTISDNGNNEVLRNLLQQDLQQSKHHRDRLQPDGIKGKDKGSKSNGNHTNSSAVEAAFNLKPSTSSTITNEKNNCSSNLVDQQLQVIRGQSNKDRFKGLKLKTAIDTSSELAAGSTWPAIPLLQLDTNDSGDKGDKNYKGSEIKEDLGSADSQSMSTVRKGENNNNSSSHRESEGGLKAIDVWGAPRGNSNLLSYVVSLSGLMFGGESDDWGTVESERYHDGFDGICGGHTSDNRCFSGSDIYRANTALSLYNRRVQNQLGSFFNVADIDELKGAGHGQIDMNRERRGDQEFKSKLRARRGGGTDLVDDKQSLVHISSGSVDKVLERDVGMGGGEERQSLLARGMIVYKYVYV